MCFFDEFGCAARLLSGVLLLGCIGCFGVDSAARLAFAQCDISGMHAFDICGCPTVVLFVIVQMPMVVSVRL